MDPQFLPTSVNRERRVAGNQSPGSQQDWAFRNPMALQPEQPEIEPRLIRKFPDKLLSLMLA
jgi:hypothetical protein